MSTKNPVSTGGASSEMVITASLPEKEGPRQPWLTPFPLHLRPCAPVSKTPLAGLCLFTTAETLSKCLIQGPSF